MAQCPTDRLASLPPELLRIIYSYIFPEYVKVWVAPTQLNDLRQYSWQKKQTARGSATWPEHLLEALLTGMPITQPFTTPLRPVKGIGSTDAFEKTGGRRFENGSNMTVGKVIHDLTGQRKDRKQISSEIQTLFRIGSRAAVQPNLPQALAIHNCPSPAATRKRYLTISLLPTVPLDPNRSSLSKVNHFHRAEIRAYFTRHKYEFASDVALLQLCGPQRCPQTPEKIPSMSLILVEGHMAHPSAGIVAAINRFSPRLVDLTVLPRDPRRVYSWVPPNTNTWGPQTIAVLKALPQIDGKVRVRLIMRGPYDCTRFEREHCGEDKWSVVDKDHGPFEEASGRVAGWEQTVYQLH